MYLSNAKINGSVNKYHPIYIEYSLRPLNIFIQIKGHSRKQPGARKNRGGFMWVYNSYLQRIKFKVSRRGRPLATDLLSLSWLTAFIKPVPKATSCLGLNWGRRGRGALPHCKQTFSLSFIPFKELEAAQGTGLPLVQSWEGSSCPSPSEFSQLVA